MTQLRAAIDDVADGMQFNGMTLLDGSYRGKQIQIGANAGDAMRVDIGWEMAPPVPPVPPVAPKFAVWNVDKAIEAVNAGNLDSSVLNPFVVESTAGDGASVTVPLDAFSGVGRRTRPDAAEGP